ncbi:hypothetical protein Pmani_003103 [Petrolisthes manimaculis]|uniref:Exonuclease domain-containing protein n=1 Tax=Petrolisthes manimaculis TaxID=1843537 RepID=A0AAE1UJT3_9EUCA|nr:hypothetical protein Pmani_003103 [Petrolisthes manimaculis]
MATKRLAKKHGLVQKRRIEHPLCPGTGQAKQEFDYLLVLDFESTCWEIKCHTPKPEIIEFPAVLLDLQTGEILAEFQQYVMPVEKPILSSFCTALTGITQRQVEAGVPLGTCLVLFSRWIRELCKQYHMTFSTTLPGKRVTTATWSDWDLGICLHQECLRKQLKKPDFFNIWLDVRLSYKNFYRRSPKGLAGALQDLGMVFKGREHSGIVDARNTAILISRMVCDGCILTVTSSLTTCT